MSSSSDIWYWIPLPDPVGLALGVLIGLFWMTILCPAGWLRDRLVWLSVGLGVVLFPPAIAWVQVPLQAAVGSWLVSTFGLEELQAKLLVAAIPQTLLSGFVQELAKLLPLVAMVLLMRVLHERRLLQAGAGVGMGFGAIEAAWVFGLVFSGGWSLDTVRAAGWPALLPFIERFVVVGLHTALAMILAYGLVGRIVLPTYLLAAFLHSVTNYGAVLLPAAVLDVTGVQLYLAFWTVSTIAIALWLRRHALRAGEGGWPRERQA